MKNKLFLIGRIFLMALLCFIIVSYSNEKDKRRIAELEKQVSNMAANQFKFSTFQSFEELGKFIGNNYNSRQYSLNSVAVNIDSLRNMLNTGINNNYKGPVVISIVHSPRGMEAVLNFGLKICGPAGICCPPQCRYEKFDIMTDVPRNPGDFRIR